MAITKEFTRQELEDLELPESAVFDTIVGHSRWSVQHEIIFRDPAGSRHWRTWYSVGATENQDEYPWEYDDVIACVEVEQKQISKIAWVEKE